MSNNKSKARNDGTGKEIREHEGMRCRWRSDQEYEVSGSYLLIALLKKKAKWDRDTGYTTDCCVGITDYEHNLELNICLCLMSASWFTKLTHALSPLAPLFQSVTQFNFLILLDLEIIAQLDFGIYLC